MDKKDVFIFFDEFDSLGGKKGDENNKLMDRITNLIATKMDGMSSNDFNTYFAATNDILALDPKLIRAGRFDKAIYIGVPKDVELKEIFDKQINSVKYNSGAWLKNKIDLFKEVQFNQILERLYQKSKELRAQGKVPIVGADVKQIIKSAEDIVAREAYQGKPRLPNTEDFIKAIDSFKKMVAWQEAYEEDALRTRFGI